MELSPRILGMGAVVLVAGIAGSALGTVPPMQQRGASELLPEARTIAFDHRPQADLPDHYPLGTRTGTVAVSELGERGLYSQARYAWRAAYAAYDPDADWAEREAEAQADPGAGTRTAMTDAAEPLPLT